ncbi:ATP-binding cassette domain-containing protein [Streptomyces sp. UNOB3_S3]|uniref:ATP-binding cassette domain-containing protein n=1 Tax=Streptomyces sp. UNOB3_S3 TaxID=2871682 RepID=UPI001E63EF3E|nr:ATP-binding cassette domain-containing protein [Streptomyces sp. UNOB3_S3]MCC3779431.1 ATP-binding cassette domain-containing protein [Streptomyces sp. UNOB3_S3]
MDGTPHGAAIAAEGLGVRGPRGWAFRAVDVDAPPGSLVAVEGPSGSGRTCLLLTLTGRMRPSAGRAEVAGLALPRRMAAVRRVSALAHVPGVAELDASLTVAEHLRERALLQRRFGAPPGTLFRPGALFRTRAEKAAREAARTEAALTAAGLEVSALPKGAGTAVRDLGRLEALRLALALALVGAPRLVAVDDTDLKLTAAERDRAWALLRSLAGAGTTVLAVCAEAPPGDAVVVRTAPTTSQAPSQAPKGAADAFAETGRP